MVEIQRVPNLSMSMLITRRDFLYLVPPSYIICAIRAREILDATAAATLYVCGGPLAGRVTYMFLDRCDRSSDEVGFATLTTVSSTGSFPEATELSSTSASIAVHGLPLACFLPRGDEKSFRQRRGWRLIKASQGNRTCSPVYRKQLLTICGSLPLVC